MVKKVLPEWSGPELIYMRASESVAKFGYASPNPPSSQQVQYSQNIRERMPSQDGEPAPERVYFPDAATASGAIKRVAREFGADMVGVTHVDQRYVYKGHDVPHRYAIVVAVAMDFNEIAKAPSKETRTEVHRIYDAVSQVTVSIAKYIRDRGYPARAHTLVAEQLAMLPHAYSAGLGELGKHGSLINRELGCSFRVGVVSTDLPLIEGAPCPEGIDDFCTKCQMCVSYCPGDAISHDKQEVRGVVRWVVDTGKCAPYFASYGACAICIQVCPLNAKAFNGKFKQTFVEMIRGIDLEEMRTTLKAGVQKPWSLIPEPVKER